MDSVFAKLAKVLLVCRRPEVIALELETHVVFTNRPAIGNSDFHRFTGAKGLTTENVIFPLVYTYGRGVKIVQNGVRPVFQREHEVFGHGRCRANYGDDRSRQDSGKLLHFFNLLGDGVVKLRTILYPNAKVN